MANQRNVGKIAEIQALDYLIKQGLVLIQQNFTSRFGEIDLIMKDQDTIVFVEVRQRTSTTIAIESINYFKQQKLLKAAKYYLLRKGNDISCRFDAVAISNIGEIKWLKNIIIGY